MGSLRFLLVLSVGVILAMALGRSAQGQARPSTQPAIGVDAVRAETLLRDLDNPDPQIRRRASLQLNSLRGDALPAVEAAAEQPNLSPDRVRQLNRALSFLRPRALHEREARERFDWKVRTWTDAYEHSGHTSPVWDADVRQAITLFLRLGPNPFRAAPNLRKPAMDALASAITKGCDDPLLPAMLSLFDEAGDVTVHPPGGLNPLFPVKSCMKENYPAAMKLQLLTAYVNSTRHVDPALGRGLPSSLVSQIAPGDLPRGEFEEMTSQFYDAARARRTEVSSDDFVKALNNAEAAKGTVAPLQLKSVQAMDTVRDVYPRLVTWLDVDSATRAADLVKTAQDALEQAWQIDPHDARTATLMISVKRCELDSNGGSRKEMEVWFRRAMEIDPDDFNACYRKLEYLAPQWHGSNQDMLEFGRECLRTQNWRAGIPNIVVDAHEWIVYNADDSKAYYADPRVWQDISDVAEGAVVNFPTAANRSLYAKWAALCGRWSVAHALFQEIGDRPALNIFGSRATFEYLRDKAARLAAATQPASGADAARRD